LQAIRDFKGDLFPLINRWRPAGRGSCGGGAHYCLGANWARLELSEAMKFVTQRVCNSTRTGPALWKPLAALSGPVTLPVQSS